MGLHEYVHYVVDGGHPLLARLGEEVGSPTLRAICRAHPTHEPVPASTAAGFDASHGPSFYRLAAHLVARSWRLWPGGLVDLVGTLHCTRLAHPLAYANHLGDECRRLAALPLAEVAGSSPPPEFAAFAAWDAERAARLREAATSPANHPAEPPTS